MTKTLYLLAKALLTLFTFFVPHDKQKQFMSSFAFVVFFIAGVGTGKSLIGAFIILLRALKYPQSNHLVAAPTYKMLDMSAKRKIQQILKVIPIVVKKTNEQKNFIEFINGSKIYFYSMEDPDVVKGAEFATFWIDELAQIRTNKEPDKGLRALDNCIQRLRDHEDKKVLFPVEYADFDYKGYVTTTPLGKNFLWRILIKEPHLYPNYEMIHCTTYENEANLPKNYINNLKQNYSPAYFKQEVLAEFTDHVGKVFNDFKDEHKISKKKILELIKEKKIVGFYLGKDWGKRDNGVTVVIGVGLNEQGYTVYYLMKEIVKTGIPAILPTGTNGLDWFSMDTAILDEFRSLGLEYLGGYVETADPTGANIAYARNGFTLKKVEKSREGSVQVISSFFYGDRFYICLDCVESIKEFDNYTRDDNGLLTDGHDHVINSVSYVIYNLEFKKLLKIRNSYQNQN